MILSLIKYFTKPGTLTKTELDSNWQAIIGAFAKVPDKGAIQVHTVGPSITIANGKTWLIINPNALLAALSIILPAIAEDGDVLDISFGGTIASGSNVVTLCTVAANTGHTLIQATNPSLLKSGELLSYRFYNNTWYRIK